ncbi:MAG: efflux RND transporter periplasmic adaptor subunit [Kiritimatiellia bacterium]
MKTKTKAVITTIVVIGAAAVIAVVLKPDKSPKNLEITGKVKAERKTLSSYISTTGTVNPQNRLEVKPPIAGRIEEILVKEGDSVERGQTLAWMSSAERAALLDAARARGEDSLKEWQDVYKPAPLIAPIGGEVIVRAVESGQTVSAQETVIVLADRLIVQAQVDETDIGRISVGQSARITLDAYPERPVEAIVDHIAYESKLVNNVIIYKVDLLPEKVPPFFRSGMSATVDIVETRKENVTALPHSVVHYAPEGNYVYVEKDAGVEARRVELGISGDRYVEISSGIDAGETVLKTAFSYGRGEESSRENPFLPSFRKKKDKKDKSDKKPKRSR